MIHFKNNNGFTLLEVLVAVMIVAMIMGPLFLWQTSVMSRTYQASGELNRLFIARSFLVSNQLPSGDKQPSVKEEAHKDPAMMLKYEEKKIPENSSIKSFNNIVLTTVTFSWKDGKSTRAGRLVSFTYKKPESKKP